MKDVDVLLMIKPEGFSNMILESDWIYSCFKAAGAGWVHSGNPKDPHAELVSGNCSTVYFDVPRVLKYPNLAEIFGRQLGKKLRGQGIRSDWVVSSAYAAITFGHEVAKEIGATFQNVEKDPSDPAHKKMIWRRMSIPEGVTVLQIEELITTKSTTDEVRRAVEEGNEFKVNFLDVVGALIHRPPKLPVNYHIVSLLEMEAPAWKPDSCPLCAAGSQRFWPKTHWKELTGKK